MKTCFVLWILLGTVLGIKNTNINKAGAGGLFTASVGGKTYVGKNNHATLSINYANMGINVFTIESFSSNDAMAARTDAHFVFLIHFTGKAPLKGSYPLQDANFKKPFSTNTGKYDAGSSVGSMDNPMESIYSFAPAKGGSGSVTIADISGNAVSGTFSGTAINSKKEKIVITGKFTNLNIL